MKESAIPRTRTARAATVAVSWLAVAWLVACWLTATAGALGAEADLGAKSKGPATDAAKVAEQLVNEASVVVPIVKKKSPGLLDAIRKSKGIVIIPNVVKGAAIVGGAYGEGVLLTHKDGKWLGPAFVALTAGSIGLQAGAKAGALVLVLMSDKAVQATVSNVFSFAGAGELAIVNWAAKGRISTGDSDAIVWVDQVGFFAGLDLSGSEIAADPTDDLAFYGRPVSLGQILDGAVTNDSAKILTDELPG